jgi:hypothetical protein
MTMKALVNRIALSSIRLIPNQISRHLLFLLRSHPQVSDRLGYHIRPIQYYEPIPDFRTITTERLRRRRDYPSIDFNWPEQLRLIARLAQDYCDDLENLTHGSERFNFANEYFAGFDATVYYALIRHLKPNQVTEIGGGFSTRIAAKALDRNRQARRSANLICIEPHPQPRL